MCQKVHEEAGTWQALIPLLWLRLPMTRLAISASLRDIFAFPSVGSPLTHRAIFEPHTSDVGWRKLVWIDRASVVSRPLALLNLTRSAIRYAPISRQGEPSPG